MFVVLFARRSLLTFSDMALQLSEMADYFVLVTLIPMGVLAVLVSVSNISLILHEGKRPANLLGIAISVVWLVAIFLWLRWWSIGSDMNWSYESLSIVSCLISVAIAFGECLLLSTIICAWLASRHMPKHSADYLVILGCGIRADGTPSPLLAGRVDKARAIKYGRLKKRRGHKRAVIAVARMMLVCIYHMLSTGEMLNPSDYDELKNPKPKAEPLTEESALAFLAAQGYDISKIVAVA